MKKVVLFIDSEPLGGGIFQYNLAVLEALSSLPKDKYKIVVMYTNKLWARYINATVDGIYIEFSSLNKRFLQFLMMSGLPVSWLSTILTNFHHIAKKIITQDADLYIFPSQETFWGYITKVPTLISIHDLMHKYERRFPEVSGYGRYRHREKHFFNVCMRSKGILVDSEYGRNQVYESYGFPLDKIFALPYIAPSYIYDSKPSADFDARYRLPTKYIFYPAQFWQHKNHERLIKAINSLKEEISDINLVLVGSQKNAYEEVVNLVNKLELNNRIHFMGFVPDNDIPEFYRRARALVMPTFFGPTNIPPLEAFATGCPVAISNIYGIPEQVGDAALLFDPTSEDEIADAIKRLWTDDALCQALIKRGKKKIQNWGSAEFNKRCCEVVENILLKITKVKTNEKYRV